MRQPELYTEKEELLQVFRLVNNYLDPGGIFLFDMNTVHKYRDILGDDTIAENRDEGSLYGKTAMTRTRIEYL